MSTKNKSSRFDGGTSLRNSDIAMRLVVIIGLGAFIGWYLDGKLHSKQPIYTIVCCLVAIFVAIFWIIKEMK